MKKQKLRRVFKNLNRHPDEFAYDTGQIQFYKNSENKWMWKNWLFTMYVEGTRKQIKEYL